MAILGPVSNVLFRAGMERVGALSGFTLGALLLYGSRMLTNGFLVLGTFSRILFTVISFLVLSWADYSYVTPVSSVNYGIVALLGSLVLGESVSPERWIGIGLICAGVALVGITPVSTTQSEVVKDGSSLEQGHPSAVHEHS